MHITILKNVCEIFLNIVNDLVKVLGEPDLNTTRLHIESVSEIPEVTDRVHVQFLLMNGGYDRPSPHEILMKLKKNYDNGDNEFTKQHSISNLIFKEPSIILDKEGVDVMRSLATEREETKAVDEDTLIRIGPRRYNRVANFGCDIMLEDFKNGRITSSTPLGKECEDIAEKYFRGYSTRKQIETDRDTSTDVDASDEDDKKKEEPKKTEEPSKSVEFTSKYMEDDGKKLGESAEGEDGKKLGENGEGEGSGFMSSVKEIFT